VINVPTHESTRLEDNFLMRRTAVDFGIPLLTNMQLVKVFTNAMFKYKNGDLVGLKPDSLFEHYAKETNEEAWTKPREFH
jgi:carbamoyl-phosphate synthase (ammonia)